MRSDSDKRQHECCCFGKKQCENKVETHHSETLSEMEMGNETLRSIQVTLRNGNGKSLNRNETLRNTQVTLRNGNGKSLNRNETLRNTQVTLRNRNVKCEIEKERSETFKPNSDMKIRWKVKILNFQ